MDASDRKPISRSLGLFIVLTLALPWLPWIPELIGGRAYLPGWERFIQWLAAFSPSLVGIVMIYLTKGVKGRRSFWCRIIDLRRISGRWYLFILLFSPLLAGLTVGVDALLGGEWPSITAIGQLLTGQIPVLGFILTSFTGSALAQELGWRGFALSRLSTGRSALTASLILGGVWGLWHLPSWIVVGAPPTGVYAGANPVFWVWAIGLLAESVVYTWVYNNTHRSILSALLLHFMSAITFTLIYSGTPSVQTAVIGMFLRLVAAVGIVWLWGSKELIRYPENIIRDYPGVSSPAA